MPVISEKLIVALDVDSLDKAKYFVDLLYPTVKLFKVGSQLFTACGPDAVKMISEKGAQVFLDLKFYDIPNTVAHAVRQAVGLKVKMMTLHISGGEEMLKDAVGAAADESARLKIQKPLLIGVTVLTSQKTSFTDVLALARLGLDCGLDGVVCSAQEVSLLRESIKDNFVIVTPGIRPKGSQKNDQKRIATPKEAIESGANYIVVGRPILEAKEPLLVVNEILKELGGA